jgi:hypothetical protein
MRRNTVPRPTFAGVTAVLALVMASAGTGYAAGLAKDSVRSKNIVDGQVRTADLGRDSVKSAQVDDGSLRAQDFRPGEIPPGPAGAPGVSGYDVWTPSDQGGTTSTFISAQENDTVITNCPAGKKVFSGGVTYVFPKATVINRSGPMADGTGWLIEFTNPSDVTGLMDISIVCGMVT